MRLRSVSRSIAFLEAVLTHIGQGARSGFSVYQMAQLTGSSQILLDLSKLLQRTLLQINLERP